MCRAVLFQFITSYKPGCIMNTVLKNIMAPVLVILVMEAGETLRPDIIIVSFNYNDRRYVLNESDTDSDETVESNFRAHRRQALVDLLKTSYLVRALDYLLETAHILQQDQPELPATVWAPCTPGSVLKDAGRISRTWCSGLTRTTARSSSCCWETAPRKPPI